MKNSRDLSASNFQRIRLLASDYDGTLALQGHIAEETAEALREAKRHRLSLALITGREFDDLIEICRHLELFDLVVAEDGGLLYFPATDVLQPLVNPPSPEFISELTRRGIPFSCGRVIVSTEQRYTKSVEGVMRKLDLELHTTFNKGSAMYLPKGTDKGSGLLAGLQHLGINSEVVVGVGDAENDVAFLRTCGLSVAVANALDVVKAQVDIVLDKPAGEGVAAFIKEQFLVHQSV